MIKKIIVSFLIVVAVICGINFGIANTTTNTAYAAESDASAFKMASVSPYDLYPTGTEANVPLKIMEGDDEICTIKIDPGLTLVANESKYYSSLRILKYSTVKIIPNESFSIKKIYVQGVSNSSASNSIDINAAQGTKIDYKSLTDDEKNLLGNPSNSMSVAVFEINDEYAVTEETPYEMTTSMQFFLKTIHVVYERLSYSATVYPKKGSYDSLDAGDFNVGLAQIGYNDSTGVMIMTGSIIVITHAPGYVIKSVILKTTYNISISGEPEFTYEKTEEDAWMLTNFPISSSYVIKNRSSQGYFLSSITINYEEHVHDEVYKPSYDDTYHFNQCGCLLRTDEEEHDFNEPTVTQPTYNSKGESKATCKICNYEKVEELLPNIADAEVRLVNELVYSGGLTQTQEVEVTYDGNVVDPANYKITGNSKFNAGDYTLKITGQGVFTGVINVPFTIKKAVVEKPVADDTVFTYNGQPQTYNLQASNLYTISNATQTNAGSHTVSVAINNMSNVQWADGTTDKLSFSFVINKATYDMSGVVFADKTVVYDGTAFSIEATNLPDGVTVAYENNAQTNAGEYIITAKFTGNANYNDIADKTATLTIEKATYDMSGVVFADKTVTYNGSAFSIEATNLPDGVTVSYENNGKTDAGEYDIIAKFTGDADNYNLIDNKIAKLIINKVSVVKPTADDKVFTYNGQAQTYALQENSLYTISDTTFTNAGNHTITVSLVDKTNYKWDNGNSNDLTYSFVIAKATYDMDGVVFANKTVVYNGSVFSVEATNLPNGVTVTYENNGKTDAGEYTITAKFTGNANYNDIADKTAKLIINKATYNMDGVVFANKTVVYNGSVFSVEATNLPNGVTVTYENNGKTDAGVYIVTAKFTGDAHNYELIADKTATLTINKALISFDTNNEDDIANDIIISSNDGIDPTKELVVKLIESEKTTEDFKEYIDKNQKVAVAYDVKLLKDGAAVQPDGTLQFKVLIPAELKGKNFNVIHVHNGSEASVLEYQIEGDYIIFETDKLSEFVFVYDMGSILWAIIVLGVVALLEIAFLVFLSKKNKQLKSTKLMSAYPPFIFGMFIPEWEVVLVIALTAVVIVLAVVSIIYAVKVLNEKAVVVTESVAEGTTLKTVNATEKQVDESEATVILDEYDESVACADETNGDDSRNVKSFIERLTLSSPEIFKYYDDIKNELLSYKKIKSRISYKHETFKVSGKIVAKLKFRGKTLCLYLALTPNDYYGTKYKVEDMSGIFHSNDVPTMYKISVPRRVEYAKKLISDVMGKFNVEKN